MQRLSIFILFLLVASAAPAQGLAAFHDYRNYFMVFDKGMFYEAEYLKVNNFKVTKSFVVYVASDEKLKAFQDGKKNVIAEYFEYFYVGEDFVVYEYRQHVFKYSDGITTELCDWCNATATDSLLRIVRNPGSIQEITINGKTTEVTRDVETTTMISFRMSKNVFAFTDVGNNLRVMYKGEVWDMQANDPGKYLSAANIVAWTDKFENLLKVFYKGFIYDVDDHLPKNMVIADNMLAFIDYAGKFKIFYDGKTIEISSFEPQKFLGRDDLIIYELNNQMKVFWKGKEYILENYIPKLYGFSLGTFGYIDQYGKLAVFSNGEQKKNLSYEKANKLELYKDVLMFTTGINTINAFWEGKVYTY